MIKLRIVCVGKMKEKYYSDACREYLKRLSRYASVDIKELADSPTPENPSEAQKAAVLKKEEEAILKSIAGYDIKIALAIEGRALSSPGLSKMLEAGFNEGKSAVFIIGGSFGLSENVKNACTAKISFSPMTFPHRLFRVMLLEQIYRSFKIMKGENYHK